MLRSAGPTFVLIVGLLNCDFQRVSQLAVNRPTCGFAVNTAAEAIPQIRQYTSFANYFVTSIASTSFTFSRSEPSVNGFCRKAVPGGKLPE